MSNIKKWIESCDLEKQSNNLLKLMILLLLLGCLFSVTTVLYLTEEEKSGLLLIPMGGSFLSTIGVFFLVKSHLRSLVHIFEIQLDSKEKEIAFLEIKSKEDSPPLEHDGIPTES